MDQLNKSFQKIIENKNVFLVLVVLLISIVTAVILFGDYSTKIMNYKKINQDKMAKLTLIESYKRTTEAVTSFMSSLPKPLAGDELVNRIEEYALRHNINISSVNSTEPKKGGDYMSSLIRLKMKVKNFKDLVAFFNTVETSPYNLKIEGWLGKVIDPLDGSFNCDVNIIATQQKI